MSTQEHANASAPAAASFKSAWRLGYRALWPAEGSSRKRRLPGPIPQLPPMDMTQFRCGRKTEGLHKDQTG